MTMRGGIIGDLWIPLHFVYLRAVHIRQKHPDGSTWRVFKIPMQWNRNGAFIIIRSNCSRNCSVFTTHDWMNILEKRTIWCIMHVGHLGVLYRCTSKTYGRLGREIFFLQFGKIVSCAKSIKLSYFSGVYLSHHPPTASISPNDRK